ncbi:MAG: UPF0758 domain-containing protein, partial [Verrucomicrobiota bacterium]
MLIKDLPQEERPREKLASRGAKALTDAEILALFLGTGRQGASAVDMGRELIKRFGSLQGLTRTPVQDLEKVQG